MENEELNEIPAIPEHIFGYDLKRYIWQLKSSGEFDAETIAFLDNLMAIKISKIEPRLLKEHFALSQVTFHFYRRLGYSYG